jgi:hypothetical protein
MSKDDIYIYIYTKKEYKHYRLWPATWENKTTTLLEIHCFHLTKILKVFQGD